MFRRAGDAIVMELTERESEFFGQVPRLFESVGEFDDDPGLAVLRRPFYLDDPTVDAELQALVSSEMESQRNADRVVLDHCCTVLSSMTREEANGLLRALNEARLILAARAGVFDMGQAWEDRIDEDPALAAVAWLGYVQGELISVLTADI